MTQHRKQHETTRHLEREWQNVRHAHKVDGGIGGKKTKKNKCASRKIVQKLASEADTK